MNDDDNPIHQLCDKVDDFLVNTVLDGTIAPVSVAAVVMARLVYLIKATDSEDVFLSLLDEVKASIKNEYVPPDVVLN